MKRYIKSTDDIAYTEDNLKMYEKLAESRYADWVAAVSCKHPNSSQVKYAEKRLSDALEKLEKVENYFGITHKDRKSIGGTV